MKLRKEMNLVKVTQLPFGKARVMSGEGTELGGRRSGFLLLMVLCPFFSLGLSFPICKNVMDRMISRVPSDVEDALILFG